MKRGATGRHSGAGVRCPEGTAGRFGGILWTLTLAASVLFLAPGLSVAQVTPHYANSPEGCPACHTSSTLEGDANTEGISFASRTLPTMRILNGTTPLRFGCTFCHNNIANTTKMKGVLASFQGKTSMHPVGKKLSALGGTDTFNEFLSGYGSATNNPTDVVDELDCLDCHDPLLTTNQDPINLALDAPYANHADPELAGARANNRYMLRDWADTVDTTYPDYSTSTVNFCRICHGTVAVHQNPEGQNVTLTAHAETAIAESDGTALKTSECSTCHVTHSSPTNYKLFAAAIDMGNASNCTNASCHENGDANNNFEVHGHGMNTSTAGNTLNFSCSACHSVNSRHNGSDDATNPKMFNYTEDPTPSAFGKSVESVCYVCHGSYHAHTGGGGNVSCLDCHDEHAEGVGNGSNSYMIPQQLPNNNGTTDLVTFDIRPIDGVPFDYYRNDGAGICDNGVCHAGVQAGVPLTNVVPLSSFMTSGKHSNGNQSAETDCGACHNHSDPSGSWGASASCDNCHADATGTYNTTLYPRTHGNGSESLTIHSLHVGSPLVGDCNVCHPHNGKTDSPTSSLDGTAHMNGTVDFGGTMLGAAGQSYSTTDYGGASCTAVNGCHDAEAGEWANPLRLNANGDGCADCHGATGKTLYQGGWPETSGRHTPHIDNNTYVPNDCGDCHGAGAATGGHAGHKNGTIETEAALAYSNATGDCTNSCHDVVPATADWLDTNSLACANCHAGTYIGGGANAPATGLHATAAGSMISGNPHDISFDADGSRGTTTGTCTTCHNATPSATHVNGTLDSTGITFAAGMTFTDGATPTCGPTGGALTNCHDDAGAWRRKWSATADDANGNECDNCHGMFKGAVGTGDNTWVVGISERHGSVDANGGLEANHVGSPAGGPCFQCHTADTVGSQTYYTFATQHRDGVIQLNNGNGFQDNGANVGCANCHSGTGASFADGQFIMADTYNGDGADGGLNRWGRLLQAGPAGSCDGCHDSTLLAESGFAAHGGANENDTLHTAHQSGPYISGCDACHTHNGTGPDHNNGTVNFAAAATGKLDSALNYARTATFGGSCTTNDCHDSDAGEWAAGNLGTDECVDCHRSGTKDLGNGKAPTSGLHAVTATNVQKHDETLQAGNCVNCHATNAASPASHINGIWEADAAANSELRFITRASMTYTEAAPNSSTCFAPSPATGLDGCHRDGGEWARLWSTDANTDYVLNPNPGQAVCNVCHGQYSALAGSTGWRQGTSHYRAGAAAATEDKGVIHMDPAPDSCEDCHAYDSAVVHDSDAKINFSDLAPTGYTATYAATPNRWYCVPCHTSASAEDPLLTSTHTFPDSLAFPGTANVTHTNGVSEPTGCSGCHGNSANNTIWPEDAGAPVTLYPRRDGRHVKHVTVLMNQLNATNTWLATPATDRTLLTMTQADQEQICAFCHTDDSPSFGHATHYDAANWNGNVSQKITAEPADVGNFNQYWSPYNPDAGTVGSLVATTYNAGSGAIILTGACNAIDCHNGQNTPAGYEWYGATTTGCVMCHVDVTAEATHTSHTGAAATYGVSITCATCHTTALVFGSPGTPPATGHIGGSFTVAAGGTYAFSYSGFTYPTVKGSCGTNDCHRSDAGVGAPYSNGGTYTWGTALPNNCEQCHRGASILSNKHQAHLTSNALPPAGAEVTSCYACHTTTATAGGLATGVSHLNEAVELSFNASFSYEAGTAARNGALLGAQTTCASVKCHNGKTTPQWSAGILCGDCHGSAGGPLPDAVTFTSIAGSHAAHANNDVDPTECGACHQNAGSFTVAGGNANHQNLVPNLSISVATYADAANTAGGVNYVAGGGDHTDNGTCTFTSGCHGTGAPVWGAAGSVACNACHGTPPNGATGNNEDFAHSEHYAAKGWAADTANCTVCHPDNTTFHATVDGVTTINAGAPLTPSGTTPAITCSVESTGCHNGAAAAGKATPAWNTGTAIACTSCHAVGGTNTATQANPVSGLHNLTALNKTAHDDLFGPTNFTCTSCHTKASITGHWNGTASATADYTGAQVGFSVSAATYADAGGVAATRGTCSGTGTSLATCHSDGGNWARQWSTNANTDHVTNYNPGQAVCDVCHGQNGSWRTGTSHEGTSGGAASTRGSSHNALTGANNACEDCHAYPSLRAANHNSATHRINVNDPGSGIVETGQGGTAAYCSNCHTDDGAPSAVGTHTFTKSDFTLLTVDGASDPVGNCSGCHGNNTGVTSTATNWPDEIAGNNAGRPAAYDYSDDQAGAHVKHIDAIYNLNSGTLSGTTVTEKKNQTCAWCHPGNPPAGHPDDSASGASQAEVSRMDTNGDGTPDYWTTSYFKSLGGADDTDAYFKISAGIRTCVQVNCHGNNDTPSWYPDTAPPAWSPGYNVTAGGGAGYATVSWNGATDATGPVLYDLYMSTTNSIAAVFGGAAIETGILGTSATIALSPGTYYFGVAARDSVTPTANSTPKNEGISGGAVVTAPAGGGCGAASNQSFYANYASGSFGVDGTENPPNTGFTVNSYATYGFGRRPMQIGTTGLTAQNYRYNTWPGTGTYLMNRFYIDLGGAQCIGSGTANNVSGNWYARTASTNDNAQVRLVIYDPTGSVQNGTTIGTSATLAGSTGGTARAWTMTIPQTQIPDNMWLVMEVWMTPAATSDQVRTYIGGTTTTTGAYFTAPMATLNLDATAPTWAGGISGIGVVDPGTDGDLSVSWNAATDNGSPNTPPVKYDLYRSTVSAADVWNNLYRANLGVTSLLDTGLTNGQTYWYGVRAKDSAAPANVTSNDAQVAFSKPTAPGACTTCHETPNNSGAHGVHAPDPTGYVVCDRCHGDATYKPSTDYTTTGPVGLHNNGVASLYFRNNTPPNATNWSNGVPPADTCSNIDCHFDTVTPSWTTGGTTCTSCHQMPPTTMPGVVDHDATLTMTLADFGTAHDQCKACHGKNQSGEHANYAVGSHGDGLVRMNGPDATPGPAAGTEYDDSVGGCNYACHPNDANHQMPTSTTRNVNFGDFGLGACGFCHETGTNGAPPVAAGGLHAGSCDECHPLHRVKDATSQVLIPNNTGLGINYPLNAGSHGGIALGGTATKQGSWAGSSPTEAEICWDCHDGIGVSEWGVNNNAQSGNIGYDYGSVTSSNWTAATWTSGTALFGYKTAAIQSTHAGTTSTGAGTTTRKGVDDLPTIRCSYCHDVHDRNQAPGDATSGQPYLRGSWRGNPYPEDGAPQVASTYPAYNSTSNYWGPVPRGGPVAGVQTGGYNIDQNSGNPVTAAWTATQFGGLCDLCHGTTKDGSLTAAEINVLNQYDANGVGWVSGTNGHINSVDEASHNATATTGGSNNQGNNIFAGRGGATNQTSTTASHPYMLFDGTSMPGDASGGFRGGSSAYGLQPAMGSRPMDGDGWANNQWNNISGRTLDLRGTTVNATFHSFSCSKCHNPHASRLPALMITNCLDTKHNSWDNDKNNPDHPTTDTVNANRSLSNWSTAQNCHRLSGNDPSDSNDNATPNSNVPGNGGWNTVTPW